MPEESNLWKDYFELGYEPEAAYYSAAPFGARGTAQNPFGRQVFDTSGQISAGTGGFAPAAQRYWSGQFGNVHNQWVGEVGRRMKSEQDPMGLSFVDFLEQYPWTERYSSMSPRLRAGGDTSRFSPSTRYMY